MLTSYRGVGGRNVKEAHVDGTAEFGARAPTTLLVQSLLAFQLFRAPAVSTLVLRRWSDGEAERVVPSVLTCLDLGLGLHLRFRT